MRPQRQRGVLVLDDGIDAVGVVGSEQLVGMDEDECEADAQVHRGQVEHGDWLRGRRRRRSWRERCPRLCHRADHAATALALSLERSRIRAADERGEPGGQGRRL